MGVAEMQVRDVMTTDVRMVRPDASVQQAADIMSQFNVGVLPVVAAATLVGMLTDRDIVLRCLGVRTLPSAMRVADAMTRAPAAIPPDQAVEDAAKRMAVLGVRRLPVVKDEQVVGILSADDLALVLEEHMAAELFRGIAEHGRGVGQPR
jgi:CBS domain-containing protein